jgi:hypothetical protein
MAEDFELLKKDIEYIKDAVKDMKEDLRTRFVTQDQFRPVKIIVYGMVALILTAVLSELITKT